MSMNWSAITTGEEFQSLVNSIVAHLDPQARLFSRPGPDGAQDAIAGDRTTVYQAKYIQNRSAATAIREALKEHAKIVEYQKPASGHHDKWRRVTHWTLATNATFGSGDLERWDKEVAPAFAAIGIVADYWCSARIASLLEDYPEVRRAYFEDEVRLFLSLGEKRRTLDPSEGVGEDLAFQASYVGRDTELARFEDFVDGTERVLLVHGPGGVGKTRFLYEASCRALESERVADVYWGNLENLEASTSWYAGLVPERSLLVLLDEPTNPKLIRRVLEELTSLRTANWKVVVSTRTPKDPIIDVFGALRTRVIDRAIELPPLSKEQTAALAENLLALYGVPVDVTEATRVLTEVSDQYPIWLVLAVSLVRQQKPLSELPNDPVGIAKLYIGEVLAVDTAGVSADDVKKALAWLGLYQPLNVEDDGLLTFIGERTNLSPDKLRQLYTRLHQRAAIRRRGIRGRLAEVKPDAVRDYLLLEWLSYADAVAGLRRQTPEGRSVTSLIADATEGSVEVPRTSDLLRRIALVEWVSVLPLNLLGEVVTRMQGLIAAHGGARFRLRLLDLASALAPFRPGEVAGLISLLRKTPTVKEEEDTLFGKYETHPRQLQLALAWTLFLAGTAAETSTDRRQILDEMIALAEMEESIGGERGLPNDGKRARALLRRLVEERRELRSSYQKDAEVIVLARLDAMGGVEVIPGPVWAATEALASIMLAIERHDSWSEGDTFHFSRSRIHPEGALSTSRTAVRERVWSVVQGKGATENRRRAWKLVEEAHSQANQDRTEQRWRDEVIDDLRRIVVILNRVDIELSDLQGARSVWDWHVQFDEDPQIKALADECESLYSAHPAVQGIAWIFHFGWKDDEALEARRTAIRRVLDEGRAEAIERFLTHALQAVALGTHEQDRRWRRGIVLTAAYEFGLHAAHIDGVRQCAQSWLACDPTDDRFLLAGEMLKGQAFASRQATQDPVPAIESALAIVQPQGRGQLLRDLYAASTARITLELTRTELDLLENKLGDDLAVVDPATWLMLARCIGLDPARVVRLLERHWADVPIPRAEACFRSMVAGIRDRAMFKEQPLALQPDEWQRIMTLMVRVPEIDRLGGNLEWELRELAKSWGRLPVSWFVEFVRARRELARVAEEPKLITDQRYHALPHGDDFFDLIERPQEADRESIEEMLGWRGDDYLTSRWLPQTLTSLDPEGVVVPALVQTASLAATDQQDLERLALFGGNYVENSAPWRSIAIAVLADGARLSVDPQEIYVELTWKGFITFGGSANEVSSHWISDVEAVRDNLQKEVVPSLRGYWEWRLQRAEATLAHERAKLAEERGE